MIRAASCAGRVCFCSPTSTPQPTRSHSPGAWRRRCPVLRGGCRRGAPLARVSSRLQLCPLLPSAPPAAGLGEGFRAAESKRRERKSPQTAPSGSPAALHLPRRPVSAGAARSGSPAPALGSAGPHARPAWAPGPGTAALDGSRTKPRARPDPGSSVSPGRRRRELPPGRGAAEFNRAGWKSGAGTTAGSPAVPPALHDPTLPTHTGKREPEP